MHFYHLHHEQNHRDTEHSTQDRGVNTTSRITISSCASALTLRLTLLSILTARRIRLNNTLLQLGVKRVMRIKVPNQNLILRIKSSQVLSIDAEEVITASSKEIKRDDAILCLILESFTVEGCVDELGAVLVVGVILDL